MEEHHILDEKVSGMYAAIIINVGEER